MRPLLHKIKYIPHSLIEPTSDITLTDRFFYYVPSPDSRAGGPGVEQGGKPAISPNERARLARTMSDWLRTNPDSRKVIEELAGVKFRKLSKEWPGVTARLKFGRITEEAQAYFTNNKTDVLSRVKGPLSKSRFAQRRQLAAAIRESQQDSIITKRKEIEDAQRTGDVTLTAQARTSEAIIDKGGRSLNRRERAAARQQALRDVLTGNSEFAQQRKAEETAQENARRAKLTKIQQEDQAGFQERVQGALNETIMRTGKNITMENATPAERQMLQQAIIDRYDKEQQQADAALREETQNQITEADSPERAKFNSLMLVDGMSAEDAINKIVADKKDAKVKADTEKTAAEAAQKAKDDELINTDPAGYNKLFAERFFAARATMDIPQARELARKQALTELRNRRDAQENQLRIEAQQRPADGGFSEYELAFAEVANEGKLLDEPSIGNEAMRRAVDRLRTKKATEAASAAEAAKAKPTPEQVLKEAFIDTSTENGKELLAQVLGLDPTQQETVLTTIKDAQDKTTGLTNEEARKKALEAFLTEAMSQMEKDGGGGSVPKDGGILKGVLAKLIDLITAGPSDTTPDETPEPAPAAAPEPVE